MEIFEDTLCFNSVVVLESLRPGDLRTGTELFEQVLVPAAAAQAHPLPVRHEWIPDADSLFRALEGVAERARDLNHWPILHLEAHGSEGVGLALADGSIVPWQSILLQLTEINLATRFNLLVVVSACWGADLLGLLYPSRPAPFWATIGPSRPSRAGDLLEGYRAFYSVQLGDGRGAEAIRAMRSVNRDLRFYPAEALFRTIFFRYVEKYCTGVTLEERVDTVFEAILGADPDAVSRSDEVKSWLRGVVLDHPTHFESAKAKCFMFDRLPENRQRVVCSYADGPPGARL